MFEGSFSVTKAPELPDGFDWINTDEPLLLKNLRGCVVVLDFWTYCCINCMHTLPTLAFLEEKYKDRPVVFIGVHSGKFPAEQEPTNVKNAVLRYEIRHPVVVDRQMRIWSQFAVNAWPTIVIVDPNGTVVLKQSGEPQKDTLSDIIDILLEKHGKKGTLAREPPAIKNSVKQQHGILSFPGKVAIAPSGKIAISDSNHNRILVCNMSGKVEYVVGSGKSGFADGGFLTSAFSRPQGLVWEDEHLFVADTENHAIRKIDFEKSEVVTVAGNGRQAPWMSHGGKGTMAAISSPWDVAFKDGLVFIAMAGSHQIWTYDIKTQDVLPFAGTGQENIIDGNVRSAQLAQPSGIYIFKNKLYFADSEVSAAREIDLQTNTVRTLVGHGLFEFGHVDGHVDDALFQHPLGICATEDTVFVADTYNSAIRVIDTKKSQVYTLIGKTDKNTVCLPDNQECAILSLYEPGDVKYHEGRLYIADTNNHLIRVFDLQKNTLSTLNVQM
jgi:thiol-disulfide isomerase/thioredoxin